MSSRATAPDASAQYLSTFVKDLREHADPWALGIELYSVRRRRRPGLRQGEMAYLMGITVTWYQKLESGTAPWSEQHAARFAQILDLSAAERFVLYRLALGWTPESVLAISGVSEAAKAAIDSFAVPALLLDHVYKVRYRNKAMGALIPELKPGDNWMTWILVSPMAPSRLAHFESDWFTPTLAQLRTAHALAEAHLAPELEVLIDVVRLASPQLAAQLWDQAPYYLTPAGAVRQVNVGGEQEDGEVVSVRLWAAQPELSPGWRVYTMEPLDAAPTRPRRRGRTR